MSKWEELNIEEKVRDLLRAFPYDPEHHFGPPIR
jgi:hypothetical protein